MGSRADGGTGVRIDGTAWGGVVHEALEASGRGAAGETLRYICRGLLMAAERPMDESGEPAELDELLAIIAAVEASDVWRRAAAAEVRLIEVPFGLRVEAAEYVAMTSAVAGAAAAPVEIIDGRIDLAFREARGWTIVDYKSDPAGSRIPADLLQRYRAQVRLYGAAWQRLTGEKPVELILLFTADGAALTA
jgi:ATP-dependent exoDNAse (exonuclease V) beta subunit